MNAKFNHVMEKLKREGVRMTPQRHAILSFLLDTQSHPSADEIYKALADRFPNMSVATVYNNLKMFVESGLIRELTYGDGASRFDADLSDHYHAICEKCGSITDFDYPPLVQVEEAAHDLTGFEVSGHRMEVYGVCSDCK